jgi:release factor glutamine methyltransferase
MTETGSQLINRIASQLNQDLFEGGSSVRNFEARLIAEHVTGLTYTDLLTGTCELADRQEQQLKSIISDRNTHKPLAYVLHSVAFCDLDLFVDERVLIPRSETEVIVERVCHELNRLNSHSPVVVDLCTGSGAIALAVAHRNKEATLYATDISADAIEVARLNLVATGSTGNRVHFYQGSLFEPLPEQLCGAVDVIVANPPYISRDENLPRSVIEFEPHVALFADDDGLALYEEIFSQSSLWLTNGGVTVCEIGETQAGRIKEIARRCAMTCEIMPDLTGRDRIAVVQSLSSRDKNP